MGGFSGSPVGCLLYLSGRLGEPQVVRLVDIPVSLDSMALMAAYRVEPQSRHAQVFEELVACVERVAKPKALYQVVFIEDRGDDWIVAGGTKLTSRALRKNVDGVERIFPYVATCGTEVDDVEISPNDIQQKTWLYFLKGELLQIALRYVAEHIKRRYQIAKLSSMSPGSGDANLWPLEQQRELFSLLGDVESQIGVRLTEAGLLIPEISSSGVFFPTETDFLSCQVCRRERCPSRRAPFDQTLWESLSEGQQEPDPVS